MLNYAKFLFDKVKLIDTVFETENLYQSNFLNISENDFQPIIHTCTA